MSVNDQVVETSSKKVVNPRIDAIDGLRGLALIGMFAVHTLRIFNEDGTPTIITMTAAGRSAAAFAVLAGVSIALMTGGPTMLRGIARGIASCGLATRALVIAILGLLLGYFVNDQHINLAVILAYYGLAFFLAIPMIGLRLRALIISMITIALVAPVLVHVLSPLLPNKLDEQPTLGHALTHPLQTLSDLLVTGSYPVLALMAYLAAGLAIGRLDLSSKKVALWLAGGGAALAIVTWVASSVLLFHFGGLDELNRVTTMESTQGEVTRTTVLWWSQYDTTTWWDLAQRASHSYSTFDLFHTIGFTAAALGALLLTFRASVVRLLMSPISAAGSMPLTIYTLQLGLLSLWTGADAFEFFRAMVIFSLLFAFFWRLFFGKGPLERLTAAIVSIAKGTAARKLH